MPRRLGFLFLSLLVLALPVFAGFGPERPLTGSDLGLIWESRVRPRIASNGDGYLVVWYDFRGGSYGIWGARVAGDGTLLDPTGFQIAPAVSDAQVVWTGRTYLVLWHRPDIGGMFARTISPEGELGTPKLALEMPKLMGVTDFAVATNGSTVLLATTLGIGALLEADGTHIGAMNIAGGAFLLNIDLTAASAAGEYLLAFGMNSGVITQRVSASGQVSAPVAHEGTPRNASVALASDGTSYFLAASETDVIGLPLTREGNRAGELRILAPAPTISGVPVRSESPSAAWRGGEYLVIYGQQGTLYSSRVSQDGTPLGAPVTFGRGSSPGEQLAVRNGTSGAAVWIDRDMNLQFAPFDSGTAASAKPINYTAPQQIQPALTRAGSQLVAAWLERRPDGNELRIAAFGGEPRVVSKVRGNTWYFEPDVLFGGRTLWVVWIDDTFLYRRYTPEFEPIDPAPVRFDAGFGAEMSFTAAAGRDGILVVAEGMQGLLATALHVEGGNVVTTTANIVSPDDRFHHAQAVWDGQRYVVAFAHDLETTWWQMPWPVPNEVLVTRVSREGALLDAAPIVITSDNPKDIDAIRVARGSDGAIAIAWQDNEGWDSIARFTGSEKPPVTVLPAKELLLGELVALPYGYAMFRHSSTEVQYERLANDLTRLGGPEKVPATPAYRVESAGGKLYLLYLRITPDERQYGGPTRLFWRTDEDPLRRRRAVR